MKKRQRKALGHYLRWVANEMQLRDWTVQLAHVPCSPDTDAQIVCREGQKLLTVSVAPHFLELDPEEQRETIVHELVHAHWETCWRMVQRDLADALGKPTYYVFADSYRRGMEYGVDALAKTIAPSMPLIDWSVGR